MEGESQFADRGIGNAYTRPSLHSSLSFSTLVARLFLRFTFCPATRRLSHFSIVTPSAQTNPDLVFELSTRRSLPDFIHCWLCSLACYRSRIIFPACTSLIYDASLSRATFSRFDLIKKRKSQLEADLQLNVGGVVYWSDEGCVERELFGEVFEQLRLCNLSGLVTRCDKAKRLSPFVIKIFKRYFWCQMRKVIVLYFATITVHF